ncbi:hypothetical protein PTW37_10115 [Arthrobacter agilis]|uniref:hypothetical protein n=1 Tax=Arthrobacter agilis TaxID=37921 RepID=UPI002365BCD8|nr:hypothetical protein [Arthrobacter agilis]WDF32229.1 hypothetical protein PTW37_10115 [Arthrobacter agilis]
MTTPPADPAPSSGPFQYMDEPGRGLGIYAIFVDTLPEVQAERGTGAGQITFRTPNGALAATGISTSARLFAAAADALALAHAVAAHEDAQLDSERQAALNPPEVQA